MQPVMDPLAMRDAVVNRLWAGFTGKTYKGINSEGKFIHEFIRQRDANARDRAGRKIARNTRRLGLINRIDYQFSLGRLTVQPRFKHELFMDDTPYNIGRLTTASTADRQDWSGISSLLLRRSFLNPRVAAVGRRVPDLPRFYPRRDGCCWFARRRYNRGFQRDLARRAVFHRQAVSRLYPANPDGDQGEQTLLWSALNSRALGRRVPSPS